MLDELPDTFHFPLPNGLDYPLVRVQPGAFIMGSEGEEAYGSERPEHLVRLTRDYYIGVYPITQAIWEVVMDGHNPSRFRGDDRPVENVSWLDIIEGGQDDTVSEAFLTRLNRRCSVPDAPVALRNFRFRLPTEAEWEYAAKGGHRTALTAAEIANPPKAAQRYPLYAGSDKLKEVGWYRLNSHGETKAVGLKQPNELGLYDMSGNVYEWCLDEWHDNFNGSPINGDAWIDGISSYRIIRGGSKSEDMRDCRLTARYLLAPNYRYGASGFRLVLSMFAI